VTETVEKIAAHVGVEPTALPVQPHYVRQADDLTDRFKSEWIVATGGCPECA
jgi:hypothetical protein